MRFSSSLPCSIFFSFPFYRPLPCASFHVHVGAMKCKTLEEGNRLPHFCFAETASPTFTSLPFLETIATQNKEVFRPVMWACTRVFGDPCIVRLSPFFKYFSHLTPNSSHRGHHNFTYTYMFPLYRRQGLCTCNLLVLLEGSLFPPFFFVFRFVWVFSKLFNGSTCVDVCNGSPLFFFFSPFAFVEDFKGFSMWNL